ncbi:acyltransferase [Aliarcobacter butzleri]|uniref:acyltransferase n=1 Tax=Aliarcobacter butzleri TaxID=28197 RepID=UPI00102DB077|nr:acyltransferase [Aliarcobacter butzleri]RZV12711.1 acyltransferase [Aliarcobacter butzleri]
MKNSEIINTLMFDYLESNEKEIINLAKLLPNKILRWLGANHPDNKTRKTFFKLTNIKIGVDSVINQNFIVSDNYEPLLEIGNRVAISPNVTIICASSPNNSNLSKIKELYDSSIITSSKVIIEDDVWIGANVVILPNVTIGKCSIIGAGSLVTKNIEPFSVAYGNPAISKTKLEFED